MTITKLTPEREASLYRSPVRKAVREAELDGRSERGTPAPDYTIRRGPEPGDQAA